MPVEKIFESLEEVPDFLRSEVLKEGDNFVFRAELPKEVTGLKSALEAERKNAESERKTRAQIEKELKAFEGIDAQAARELLAKKQEAEEEALKVRGEWDNYKAQIQKQHEDEKQKLLSELQRERDQALADYQEASLLDAIGDSGKPRLLKPFVNAKAVVEEGKRAIRVFDDEGKVRYSDGKPMTLAQRLEEMRLDAEYAALFYADGAGGGGATNKVPSETIGKVTLTREQAKNPVLYQKAKAEAANKGVPFELTD